MPRRSPPPPPGRRTRCGRCTCATAKALLRLGRGEEALAQARLILDVNPRRIGALVLETKALPALGRRDAARAALARLRAALAHADRDLPAVAVTDSLGALLDARPPS